MPLHHGKCRPRSSSCSNFEVALKKGIICWLGIVVLLAICTQMAVCMAFDHSDDIANSSAPAGSDCGCHDCACCSLHVLALYQKRSGAQHYVEVDDAATPERF